MGLPWGVKENVEPENADAVQKYIENIEDSKVSLDSDKVAVILKAGLKERKGKYLLIFRYKLV